MNEDVAQNALHSNAARTYGLEMFSASDEDDIDANRGKPRTEVSAKGAAVSENVGKPTVEKK